MLKKLGVVTIGLIILVLLPPLILYSWGLSNLGELPQPSQIKLTSEKELEIWENVKEAGDPRIKKINAYSYILSIYCNANSGLHAPECMSKYPGLRISALAVRNQVSQQVYGKGNTVWQFTWVAYSI